MKKKVLIVLSYVLVAALACGATLFFVSASTDYNKLEDLENLILTSFAGDADKTKIEDAAADAMVNAMGDRWSYYIPASELPSFLENSENAYVGIGVTVQATEDHSGLMVIAVQPGGPAEEAGVQVGDVIIQVDGESAQDRTVTEISAMIKGEEGTVVSVTVLRSGEGITMSMTRKRMETTVASSKLLNEHVGLVTIQNFDERCADETIAAIKALLNQGADMLLFDVRNNPGGYVDELTKVLDYLLPEGDLIRTVGTDGSDETVTSDASCVKVPMAVLINENTYSAAELFAADLSEYGAAKLFGQQTSGKGFYQYVFQFADGSAAGISVGRYYTGHGASLEGIGLTPDETVKLDDESEALLYNGMLEPENDAQLQAALSYLMDKVVTP
ncbi:MAG: S41 family peptidase [Clostridiales bacterium]|nr:S41 family peptidase [Clostridiales bacterium]MDD7258873.1 S41 family peptidase [Eubacteriales bacterium]